MLELAHQTFLAMMLLAPFLVVVKMMTDDSDIQWHMRRETMPMHLGILERAFADSVKLGWDHAFLVELTECRRRYGQEGLRMGHLWWIVERLNGRITDPVPPSFDTEADHARFAKPLWLQWVADAVKRAQQGRKAKAAVAPPVLIRSAEADS